MEQITAPLQLTILAELNCGIGKAAAIMAEEESMARWIPLCRFVRWEHPSGVLATGSVRHVHMKLGFIAVERVTFLEAPARLNYTVASMGMLRYEMLFKGYRGVTVLEPLDNGRCRLSWSVHFYCTGIMKLFEPLARAAHRALIGLMVNNICREAGGKRLN